jgi:hypothetical protein
MATNDDGTKALPPAATWGVILGLLTAGCAGPITPSSSVDHSQRPYCDGSGGTTDPCAGAAGTCTTFSGLGFPDGGECVFPPGTDAGSPAPTLRCGFCNG